jgi:acyl carrier protein
VLECAVIAVPDPLVTNRIRAYVVARNGIDGKVLLRFCAERIPHYMIPEQIELDLDRQGRSTGARRASVAARTQDIEEGTHMVEDSIRRFISEELSSNGQSETLTDDYPLLERQVLDSLGMFQLVSYLETEYGIEIADEELVPANFGTIGDVARLVETKRA